MNVLPKLSEVGLMTTGAVAVPETVTVSGLSGSLLARTTVACSSVVVEGVKVTPMRHVAFIAMLALLVQVVEPSIAKSAALGPEIVTALDEASTRAAVPTFLTVMFCMPLVLPRITFGKVMAEGVKLEAGVNETAALTWVELALVPAELKALTTK